MSVSTKRLIWIPCVFALVIFCGCVASLEPNRRARKKTQERTKTHSSLLKVETIYRLCTIQCLTKFICRFSFRRNLFESIICMCDAFMIIIIAWCSSENHMENITVIKSEQRTRAREKKQFWSKTYTGEKKSTSIELNPKWIEERDTEKKNAPKKRTHLKAGKSCPQKRNHDNYISLSTLNLICEWTIL